ncbi:MAG: ATP-binding protein [Parachlamydiaceae bacterium]
MYIHQLQLDRLKKIIQPGKVIVIFGPRRVGKTTLIRKFLEERDNYLFVTGDDLYVHEFLSSNSIDKLKSFIGTKTLLVIDEAQEIENIGNNLKLIVDHMPHLEVVATGSSTFDLAKHVGEPLTGRKKVLQLYPLSQMELNAVETSVQVKAHLEERLIYGSYPEVITNVSLEDRQSYLREIVSSYLYKDILRFDLVQKSKKLHDLLTLLAFQIGKEVSIAELATQLGLNRLTIERYLDLLEQVFVLINVRGFSRNLRSEVTKTSRYYFYDVGIRNAIIQNYNPLSLRNDVGELFENYLVLERLKKQCYLPLLSNNYFWRTYDQKEIDWVEEREGKLFGYEFKWAKKIIKPPKLWQDNYPNSNFEGIDRDNYLPFIT